MVFTYRHCGSITSSPVGMVRFNPVRSYFRNYITAAVGGIYENSYNELGLWYRTLVRVFASIAVSVSPMAYTENHMILGEGNFVLSVSEGQFLGKHVAFYDLFRIENGKIVEHWDTIEEIPAKDKWMNSNGKF